MFNRIKIENMTLNKFILPNWQIFTFLSIVHLLIAFWSHQLVFTKELYYALLSDQMELQRIDNFFDILERYSFLSILIIPIVLFIKYLTNTLLLQLPLLLNYIEIRFRELFRIMMLSSITLTTGQIVHLVWIYFLPLEKVTREFLAVKPLSLAALFRANNYTPSSLYILNECNFFQLLWVGCIYLGLVRTNSMKNLDAALIAIVLWITMLFINWGIYFFIIEPW